MTEMCENAILNVRKGALRWDGAGPQGKELSNQTICGLVYNYLQMKVWMQGMRVWETT